VEEVTREHDVVPDSAAAEEGSTVPAADVDAQGIDSGIEPAPVGTNPSVQSKTPPAAIKRTIIRIPRQTVTAPTPARPTRAARSKKRQAATPVESDAKSSGSDGPPPTTRKRKTKAAPPPRTTSTRTLRSRASKTQEQLQEEEAAKERLRQALASDGEMTDVSD